jgi:hypothetical protein
MALYHGSVLGGPEQIDKAFDKQITAIVRAQAAFESQMIRPTDGLLNVVFMFSGSLLHPDFSGIKVGRFIRKENRLEIKIAVPPDVPFCPDFLVRYAGFLRQAIAYAKTVFDKNGVAFSVEDHLGLVDKSLERLVEAK